MLDFQISNGSYVKMLGSKIAQEARTPPAFLDLVVKMYFVGVKVADPCPPSYTRDGLKLRWAEHNFVNPPFIDVKSWLCKALREKRHSVLLFPARTSTEYMHYSALVHCSTVLIWTNSFTFPPFTKYFSLPMMTVEVGSSRLNLSHDVQLKPVQLDRWTVPATFALVDRLAWLVATAHKRFNVQCTNKIGFTPDRMRLGRSCVTWVPVTNSPSACVAKIEKHCVKHPEAVVVALIIPSFNSEWFRRSSCLIRQIVFITPRLVFHNGKLSPLGTVLIVLSSRKQLKLTSVNTCPPTFLATWRKGRHFT